MSLSQTRRGSLSDCDQAISWETRFCSGCYKGMGLAFKKTGVEKYRQCKISISVDIHRYKNKSEDE